MGLPECDVLAAVEELNKAATVLTGGAPATEVRGADADRAAFLAPMLLRCDDPSRPELHTVDAFGPVSTFCAHDRPPQARRRLAGRVGDLTRRDLHA